jgi:histidine ammonia-lyase
MDDMLLGTGLLTVDEVVGVARDGRHVEIDDGARAAIGRGRDVVAGLAAGDRAVYGVSTGFGALATTSIPPARDRISSGP